MIGLCASVRLRWLAVLCTASALPAFAQAPVSLEASEPTPPAAEPAKPESVRLPEIAASTEELGVALRAARELAEDLGERDEQIASLRALRREIGEQSELSRAAIAQGPSLQELGDLERQWTARSIELGETQQQLHQDASRLEQLLGDLEARSAVWKLTASRARESQAPPETLATIRANQQAIRETLDRVHQSRGLVLGLLSRLSDLQRLVAETHDAVESAEQGLRSGLLEPEAVAIWQLRPGLGALDEDLAGIRSSLAADLRIAAGFVEKNRGAAALGLLGMSLALGASLALRRYLHRRSDSGSGAGLSGSAAVFERPFSIGLIAGVGAVLIASPLAPSILVRLVGVLLLVPLARLLTPLLHPRALPALWLLGGFYLLDRVRDLVASLVWLERSLLALETALAAALLAAYLFGEVRARRAATSALRPGLRRLLRLACGLLTLALFANLLGYVDFGRLLATGVLTSAYLGVVFYASFRVLNTLGVVLLSTPRLATTGLVRHHAAALLRTLRILWIGGALAAWGWFSLDAFGLERAFAGGLASLLAAPLHIGAVDFSLGGLLAFATTVVATVYVARGTRALLQEEVLPRFALQRGVDHAVSTLAHYALLLGGLALALAITGVELSRLSLIAGALGVGIGFGLQNIVNNFLSGLILLFERPIQVGDTIEIGDLTGDVQHIGIRTSTIRTTRGADVIIPNGHLVSDRVINWTLADPSRRLEIPLGVAYGTDPRRVIDLLERLAHAHPEVLPDPQPIALFRGFGASSLDFELRCWVSGLSASVQISSELLIAIEAALREAGIEIPYPQSDLHLRSLDPALRALLEQEPSA